VQRGCRAREEKKKIARDRKKAEKELKRK